MKLSYVVGGVVAIAAVGVAFFALAPKSPCNHGVCKVSVTVQDCPNGGITAAPDPIPVPSANNIEWTIDTDGYVFTANGISVHGTGFTNGGVTGSGKKFTVHDAYTDTRPSIKYAIEVQPGSSTTACKVKDPFISHQ